MLSQFANPSVLKQIGFNRLARFVAGFSDHLKAANLPVPDPDFRAEFSATITALFASPEVLPPRLRHTLLTLEKAAAPENENRLNVATSRRLANTPIGHLSPLVQALELF